MFIVKVGWRAELQNVKYFMRTNIVKPYFTPRKARKLRHFWHFKPTKQNLWGFLWWINYQFMAVCPLILIFLHISSQKWLVFANYFGLPNFLPQLANFFTRIYPSYPWHFPTLAAHMDNMVNMDAGLNGGGHFCPSCQVLATLAIPGLSPRQPGHWAGGSWRAVRQVSDHVPL